MKQNFAVFDTETIGISPKLVYDFGVIICDRNGNEIDRRSFAVREVITNPVLMLGAYYSKKTFTHYIPALADGSIKLQSFAEIRRDFNALIDAHNVRTVCAYNIAFDRNALKETMQHCGMDDKFLQHKIAFVDLWLSACVDLVNTNKYRAWCAANGFVSDAGNVRTSAECVYAYLTQNPTFKESHTAIEDCEIETAILARIIRRKQKRLTNKIHAMPWQLVQRRK
jgi:DNA polymerase III epsilon subunit-like protein